MVQVLKTSNRIKWNIKECSPIYLSVHPLTYICMISLSSPWRDRILVKSKYTLLTILTDNTYRLVNFLGIFCCESREVFKMKKKCGENFTLGSGSKKKTNALRYVTVVHAFLGQTWKPDLSVIILDHDTIPST